MTTAQALRIVWKAKDSECKAVLATIVLQVETQGEVDQDYLEPLLEVLDLAQKEQPKEGG